MKTLNQKNEGVWRIDDFLISFSKRWFSGSMLMFQSISRLSCVFSIRYCRTSVLRVLVFNWGVKKYSFLEVFWVYTPPQKKNIHIYIYIINRPPKKLPKTKRTTVFWNTIWAPGRKFWKSQCDFIYNCIPVRKQNRIWLVVSTHLKNISQNGNLPQIGVTIKNVWNHHLGIYLKKQHL